MKNHLKNRIDQLIDNLSVEFSKIPNFQLTQTDSDVNRIFNFIITKFSDIQDFKTLYKRYYIPAANKSIADARKEIKTSLYKNILIVSENQIKENYYDTIRLGYVGLFHKVENYVRDLLVQANLLFNDGKTGNDSIETFFEKKYNFKFNDWYSDLWMNKVNWICNCVKHYDGYPKKEPKYKYLQYLPENEKIRIGHEEFYKDIDYIADTYYQFKLTQILTLSLFKMATDDKIENIMTDDLREKYLNFENTVKILMK